jgi:CspA family cold shock protein
MINNLFLPQRDLQLPAALVSAEVKSEDGANRHRGAILNLLDGYGFIKPEAGGSNVFFFHADVLNRDFNDLQAGQPVDFVLGQNEKGPCARSILVVEETGASDSAQ